MTREPTIYFPFRCPQSLFDKHFKDQKNRSARLIEILEVFDKNGLVTQLHKNVTQNKETVTQYGLNELEFVTRMLIKIFNSLIKSDDTYLKLEIKSLSERERSELVRFIKLLGK